MSIEQYTRDCIRNDLENKKWIFDKSKPNCNVTQEQAKVLEQQKKLKGNRPDYVLYETNTDNIIAIIEAKHGGYTDLNQALDQAEKYAKLLQSNNRPIILFATNGSIYQTRFFSINKPLVNKKPLIFNEQEVKGLLGEDKLLLFINGDTNEIDITPKEIIKSKEDLIKIFKNLNDVLRSEGLRAGIERFTEFSNLLFLKLISEHNQKPWWEEIKSNLKGKDDTISYINNHIFKQIQGEYGGDVITPISIKNESTLKHIINAIDPLVFSTIDTDIKGDAFEYFLEKTTSTENDLGEYFTPRHVVKAIVDFVSPKYNEKIYDPFCGTGGFLTNAFHYVRENNSLNKEEEYILKNKSIYGHELTNTAKTAKMNMILQGDGHSGIQQLDSLFNPIDKKYDLIITNIPFSQKIVKKVIIDGKEHSINEVTAKYENSLAKNSGDAVCVLHCFRALKEGGRMALVVPEGFLFRNVEKSTRKFLLDNSNLEAVISLPQGTFLPYTAVKTSILYFVNAYIPKPQNEFWYYEAKNIGFSLDNHRRVIHGFNDLDMIKSSINKFKKARKNEDIKKGLLQDGFKLINLQKIINNNYNLVGGFYREVKNNTEYKVVNLKDICKCYQPKTITGDKIQKTGKYKVYGANGVIGYYNNYNHEDEEVVVTCRGATCGSINFTTSKSWITGNAMVCKPIFNNILKQYLYYILKQINLSNIVTGSAQPQITKSIIEKVQIPLPTLDQQQEIVNELDSYHKIIDGCQQVIDNWKPQFEIEESWEIKKLGDLCDLIQRGKTPVYGNSNIQVIKSGQARGLYEFNFENKYYVIQNFKIDNRKLQNADLLINSTGRGTAGRVTYFSKTGDFLVDGHITIARCNPRILLPKYLLYLLASFYTFKGIENMAKGSSGKIELSLDTIKNIKIPLPHIEQQQRIVEKIEFERNIVEQNKKLVEIYKEKVADKLDKLFS